MKIFAYTVLSFFQDISKSDSWRHPFFCISYGRRHAAGLLSLLFIFFGVLPILAYAAPPESGPMPSVSSPKPALEAPAPQVTPEVIQNALQDSEEKASQLKVPELAVPSPVVQLETTEFLFSEAVSSSSGQNVIPSMDWLLDPQGKISLNEMLFPSRQEAFTRYAPTSLPKETGTIWFRFRATPFLTSIKSPSFLDLNTRIRGQLPGIPQVWLVEQGQNSGTLLYPAREGVYPLPSTLSEGARLYIRVNGLPAPGFEPMIRTASDYTKADTTGDQVLLSLLGLSLVLCLIRGIAERREWRMWAALYTGAIWVQAFWGLPTTPSGVVSLWDMPGLLAPGIALLILPHVGRHLMRTRAQAPFLDLQLIFLALPGIALSVTPLVPGYAWTLRFLPLWPLFMLLLLPTAVAASVKKLPGAKRFLLMTLLPPLGMLPLFPESAHILAQFPALLPQGLSNALKNLLSPGVVSLIPLTSLVLSSLITAISNTPKVQLDTRKKSSRNTKAGIPHRNAVRAASLELGGPSPESVSDDSRRVRANSPLVLKAEAETSLSLAPDPDEEALAGLVILDTPATVSEPRPRLPQLLQKELPLGMVEETLRVPLDAVLRQISALDQSPLPPEARYHAEALNRAGRALAQTIGNLARSVESRSFPPRKELFDLNQLLLETHNAVATEAEAKNLALSWFTAPHLPRRYEGQRTLLAEALLLLAESAVLATDRGFVQIRAQRLPESTDPGHLLFTISDSGKGAPPLTRSTLALIRTWELVGPSGDSLTMESGPTGTTISFSLRLIACMAEQRPSVLVNEPSGEILARLPASSLRIIVASGIPGNRQLLAFYLDELPHEILEARDAEDVCRIYLHSPGALIIFDDDLPEDEVCAAVAAIRAFEGDHNFPLASILALVRDEGREERLRRAGCTHTLMKPVIRTELRHLTLRLAPVPRRYRNAFTAEMPANLNNGPSSTTPNAPISAPTNSPSRPSPATSSSHPTSAASATPSAPPLTLGPTSTKGSKLNLFKALFSSSKQASPLPTLSGDSLAKSQPEKTASAEETSPSLRKSTLSTSKEPPLGSKEKDSASNNSPLQKDNSLLQSKSTLDVYPLAHSKYLPGAPFSSTQNHSYQAPEDAVEWVGEPMPIVKPKPVEEGVREPTSLHQPNPTLDTSNQSVRKDKKISSREIPKPVTPPTPPLSLTPESHPPFPELAQDDAKESAQTALVLEKKKTVSTKKAALNLLDSHRERRVGRPLELFDMLAPETPEQLTAQTVSPASPEAVQSLADTKTPLSSEEEEIITLTVPQASASPTNPLPDLFEKNEPLKDVETHPKEQDETVFHLLQELDALLQQALEGQERNDATLVRKAAAQIGHLSEEYGLRILDDPARCLELAAHNEDMEEITQLMPDLLSAIARNRASFSE